MRLLDLNLIHFLDFYLILFFIASVLRRLDWYRAVIGLVYRIPGRWPRLLQMLCQQHAVFLTWQTVLPALLALGFALVQLIASRAVWPGAGRPPNGLTVARLLECWWGIAPVVLFGLGMMAVDLYFLVVISQVDRPLLEQYFDEAEYWLRSNTAHLVRFATFGWVDPRRMVASEVEKALVDARAQLNTSLWWMVVQLGLRIGFGLSLWLTWAVSLLQT